MSDSSDGSAYELHVPIETLRAATSVLLRHLEQLEGSVVTLREDYFWSIPADDLYAVTREPSALTIGQLSESLAHLASVSSHPDAALSYGLVWLADVLRAIGHDVVR